MNDDIVRTFTESIICPYPECGHLIVSADADEFVNSGFFKNDEKEIICPNCQRVFGCEHENRFKTTSCEYDEKSKPERRKPEKSNIMQL